MRYSCPLQFLVVSLLLPLISTLLFSRAGGILSHLNFKHRSPWFAPRNLCFFVTFAVTSLEYYLSRLTESIILHAVPVDTRPRTVLILFCPVNLRTLCAARSLATLCLSTTSGPGPGELPSFWDTMVFCRAPILERSRAATATTDILITYKSNTRGPRCTLSELRAATLFQPIRSLQCYCSPKNT